VRPYSLLVSNSTGGESNIVLFETFGGVVEGSAPAGLEITQHTRWNTGMLQVIIVLLPSSSNVTVTSISDGQSPSIP